MAERTQDSPKVPGDAAETLANELLLFRCGGRFSEGEYFLHGDAMRYGKDALDNARRILAENRFGLIPVSALLSDEAKLAAAKVIARALRHRAEQIERGEVGNVQTETPNQIAEEAIQAAIGEVGDADRG